jgi:type I restriction-modification system DNA methylase subunit
LGIERLVGKQIGAPKLYPDRLPHIIDPSCGSGSFLLSTMRLALLQETFPCGARRETRGA